MKVKIDGKEVEISKENILSMTTDDVTEDVAKELGGLNDTKVKDYLETENGKKLIQPTIDSAVTQGINTFTENNKDKFKKEGYNEAKTELEKELEKVNVQLKQSQISSKLQRQLLGEGLKKEKIDLAMRLVDQDKISIEGEHLHGVNEQLQGLKESTPEWFGKSTGRNDTPNDPPAGGNPAGSGEYSAEQIDEMTDEQFYKLREEKKIKY